MSKTAKSQAPCGSRRSTIKIPLCTKVVCTGHRPTFCSPSPWDQEILQRHVKQDKKKTTTKTKNKVLCYRRGTIKHPPPSSSWVTSAKQRSYFCNSSGGWRLQMNDIVSNGTLDNIQGTIYMKNSKVQCDLKARWWRQSPRWLYSLIVTTKSEGTLKPR